MDDSIDLSQDLLLPSGLFDRLSQEDVSQLDPNLHFSPTPDDDVKEVVDGLLDSVAATLDVDTVVREVVDDLVAVVTDEKVCDGDVIRNLLDGVMNKVELEVNDSTLGKGEKNFIANFLFAVNKIRNKSIIC